MFDIGWSELLLVAVVALLVLGPQDFPRLMRKFGEGVQYIRDTLFNFRRMLETADYEQEIQRMKQEINNLKQDKPSASPSLSDRQE